VVGVAICVDAIIAIFVVVVVVIITIIIIVIMIKNQIKINAICQGIGASNYWTVHVRALGCGCEGKACKTNSCCGVNVACNEHKCDDAMNINAMMR
jgi:hypothetical protein